MHEKVPEISTKEDRPERTETNNAPREIKDKPQAISVSRADSFRTQFSFNVLRFDCRPLSDFIIICKK